VEGKTLEQLLQGRAWVWVAAVCAIEPSPGLLLIEVAGLGACCADVDGEGG